MPCTDLAQHTFVGLCQSCCNNMGFSDILLGKEKHLMSWDPFMSDKYKWLFVNVGL